MAPKILLVDDSPSILNDSKQIQRCFQAGCDAYVVKPMQKQDIIEKTKIILSERGISI